MATKKKKSFKEWYEENYSGDKSEDKSESKNEDIAPIAPPTGDFFTFSTNKNKPIQNADIAPAPNGAEELRNQQKEAKQEQQKGFLNKGNAFSDGYQFGDITKTRRATTADIILSMAEGAGGLVEGITDWAAYGIAQAGEKIDPDAEWTKILREGAMQNTLADASAVRNLTGVDEYSLIGNRSRSVARAVGQILTQMGAAAAGAQVGIDPALVNNAIMYLSSTGGGMTQAYNEGATDEEAALYGMISGAVNVLSEMLFAGLGKAAKAFGVGKGSGIDDYVAKKLTDKIGNRILRNGLQYSVKAGAEGLEEVVAGSLEAVGKKLTYEDEKSMKELLEDEQLFEQFMTSALASGTMQGADLATSIKEGSDFVTGETKEQMAANKDAETVVKTLADERIAAEEKAGKRLTEKDKREIRKEIETAMERGELNIDDIERIVGGDEYKNYKAELERQEQIRNEKREILKTPVNKFTVEQQERLAELRAMKTDKSMVDSLKSSLDERVAKATAPGSRLSESYTQRAARGQKFEADLSKYSKEEAAIVKKAVESGYLNNTRATHELVDFVAKMCARKGISFDFLTNEKLKESGFSVDGATVNGYWDKSTKTIGLNMNSKKAFKTVIGHEMAHVLEDTDLYKDFKDTITEYAKLKGDYEGRLEQLKKIYKNKPDADVERELVADLVGDYLFTDEAFLKRLSVENRNVFQKLWDEVKYLHRLATVGSEQARELERIKHMFEKVFEETKVDQAVSKDAEVEHSLTRNKELMDDAIAKNNELFGIDLDTAQKQRQTIYDYMTKHAAELKLPPDAEGNTAFKNSSYDFSEENTSVCIRSMAADALCDAVAEDLGRPLTVQDTLYISQDLMNYTDAPECVYCYVATDRRAYREFLGSYYKQMTSAIEALKSGKNSKEVYTAFLDGRKDTKNMQKRFAMWQQIAKDGNAISASDLASERNMQEAMRNPLLAAQVKDARAYAQSASWAKKRVGYTAYNGHILEWKQSRINDLNRHYGLRFYSFSDFSPAFILENMQQITDAAVRGLKGLAYTKELDFVKIFAPSGININISVFGYDQNGTVAMDGMMGANWTEAQALRNQYENVGITFVATNDAQIEWALNQDWIDVVIPYHLVRTGQAVAKHFGYTNYTAESGDTKGANWKKGDKKTIYPAEHNNDKQTYLDAIKDANLEPRFARFVDHPNYMKLVNETRRSANNTPPMRPVFNVDAAIESLKTMAQKGGYFVPIGGDYANMQEIAGDIADKIRGNTQFSLSPEADQSYLDAVNRGDTETAQMMVDEAAKEAGYDSELLHHGTNKFGFTEIDVSLSDDGISFFATDKFDTAASYIPYYEDSDAYDKIREIGKKAGKNRQVLTANSSIEEFLDYLKEAYPEWYSDSHIITEEERHKYAKWDVTDAVRHAKELLRYSLPENVEALANLVIESEGDEPKWVDLAKAYKEFKDIPDITYRGNYFSEASHIWYSLQDNIRLLNLHLTHDLAMVRNLPESKESLLYSYEQLTGGENVGIYGLYAKTEGQLVIRGRASNWNNIPLGEITSKFNEWWVNEKGHEPAENGYYTRGNTRNIAEFAKYAGYRSVCFVDIYDTGAYGGGHGDISTIYAFFYPESDVKSADPVTYDDNGNVIPLSERFKESNNDIRYSLSPDGEDAEPIAFNEPVRYQGDIAPLPTARKVTQTTPKMADNLPMREDIAPVAEVGDIAPVPTTSGGKRRSFAKTAIESDTVQGQVLFEDLDQAVAHYEPITNAVTLTKADNKLSAMGYQKSVEYFNGQMNSKRVALEDIALGERLIQESIARGDTKTAGEMIQNLAILGTELGQKVQALSIIKRLTPEGQALMLEKIVKRGKTRGDSAYDGVEFTPEMREHILGVYNPDGSYDQDALNAAVEDVKQRIADKMKVSLMDKVNAWRYLSMLGNPKTHIRNVVSNVAMYGTVAVKNAIARTAETVAPIENRTRTWRRASQTVKTFADNMALEMSDVISDGGKYNEEASIKDKRKIFKVEVLDKVYEFNNDMLSKEDWWFSKIAFKNAFSEYLTANGIKTADDIKNNPKIVEKGKQYAVEQAQIATFRQASWLANKIGEIERKNVATEIAVGAVLPFKKTPINIAKTALNYSPLGFTKTLSYDIVQVKKGNMEASEFVDHLSQNFTGTGLVLLGYMLASLGVINGAGDDDKEGKYDYQLGKQAYSINIGGSTYSLSWLSPVAMPLFVGANAYEMLTEKNEWNGDVVMQTLAQTLDPLSEMSFLSSLDDVLSSYDSGVEKFANIGVSALQSYVSQFIPTLSSQVASMLDSKKRTTKAPADSGFKAVDETVNELKYKIPFLRNTLEPTTDIWGQTVEQDGNLVGRAFDTFLAPYTEKELIATEIDTELKRLYSETGDNGVIPSIPGNTFTYKKVKYEMSAEEYTDYKQIYGQTASILFERLFATKEYQNASDKEKAKMVNKVYEISKEDARAYFFESRGE